MLQKDMPTDSKFAQSLGTALGVLHNKFFYSFLSIIVVYGIGIAALTSNFGGYFSAAINVYSLTVHTSLLLNVIVVFSFAPARQGAAVAVPKPRFLYP